jgi:hypothetical protein
MSTNSTGVVRDNVVDEQPTTVQQTGAEPDSVEHHYSAGEVAALWGFNVETVRNIFEEEPGIIVLTAPSRKGKRPYRTIRIPQSVLDRVHRRMQR